MEKTLRLVLISVILTGCGVFDNNKNNSDYQAVSESQIRSIIQHEYFLPVNYMAYGDSDTISVSDSLIFTLSIDSLKLNTIQDFYSINDRYDQNPNIVLSSQQSLINYHITFESLVNLKNNIITIDGNVYEFSSERLDSLFTENDYAMSESGEIGLLNFNTNDMRQEKVFKMFSGPVFYESLEWIPDSTYKPTIGDFILSNNRVWFSLLDRNRYSESKNIILTQIRERLKTSD